MGKRVQLELMRAEEEQKAEDQRMERRRARKIEKEKKKKSQRLKPKVMKWSVHEQRATMEIYDHCGHNENKDRYHPKNLLVDDTKSWYFSKDGVSKGDWIIFKV